jgi:aspartyl-tRNA(Asn)/glutamyl-tRNA(Gln) amidotransferase subunit B
MNSFKNVQKALEYEIRRQSKALQAGETLVQETRLWNADQEITLSMRSKEYAHDYRYFPEPDLVPLVIEPAWIEEIRGALPELPEAKRQRFVRDYGIPEYDAGILTTSQDLAAYYEAVVKVHNDPKLVSNWVMVELLGRLNRDGKDITQSPIPPERLGGMLGLLTKGTISGKMAKGFFDEMYSTGADPADVLKKKGGQISDTAELETIIQNVLAKNPAAVTEYKGGKAGAFNFLIGQVMKATRGKANPQLVNELLRKQLHAP